MKTFNENDMWVNNKIANIMHLTREKSQIPKWCHFLANPVYPMHTNFLNFKGLFALLCWFALCVVFQHCFCVVLFAILYSFIVLGVRYLFRPIVHFLSWTAFRRNKDWFINWFTCIEPSDRFIKHACSTFYVPPGTQLHHASFLASIFHKVV